MGNALCLNRKVEDENQALGRSSPPALLVRKRSLSISKETSLQGQLQDVCVRAIGAQLLKGQVSPSDCAHTLPLDLLQRVLDHVIGVGERLVTALRPDAWRSSKPVLLTRQHCAHLQLRGVLPTSAAGCACTRSNSSDLKLQRGLHTQKWPCCAHLPSPAAAVPGCMVW
jgi:hypothetical protein